MNIALIRNMDKQGRIVIPAEIRKIMNWAEGEPLEFMANKDGLVLRKYDHMDDRDIQYHLDILFKTIHCSIAIVSGTRIVASRGIHIPIGEELSPALTEYTKKEEQQILKVPISASTFKSNYVDTIIPFGVGMSLLLFKKKKKVITDNERMAAQLVATLLTEKEPTYQRR